MQAILLLPIISLIIFQASAFYGPQFKSSSYILHRKFNSSKLDSTDGFKLPGNARPLMYDVMLTFSPISNNYTFDGQVTITLDVDPPEDGGRTYNLQLNSAVDIDSTTASTFTWNSTTSCSLQEYSTTFIDIICPEPIDGTSQTLTITYTGKLASLDEYGAYTFFYNDTGTQQLMIATQLEQNYAKRLFPCFDEPKYKAPIKLTLRTDNTLYGLSDWISNMNEESGTQEGNIVTTVFETTPNMSTYLLAFVMTNNFENFPNLNTDGDYDFMIFARPSAEYYLNTALENGPTLINLMGNFTGITYGSLGNNRMVFVPIPEFSTFGAMENWGLITFREQILLDEDYDTTARDKQYIIQVIAHEISHQWFGDYVTMDWWSEAWLNEGFATYFEYYLPNQISPDFDMLKQFVVKEKQQALKTDAYSNAIPLSNNLSSVTTDADEKAEFGDITYIKGASIIKILNHTLGEDAFKSGLQTYLHNNNYSNPTAHILLDTLQTVVSDEQTLNLSVLFNEWIYESGYPLLNVSVNNNKVTIQVTKFTTSLNKTAENNTASWWIPLTFTTSERLDFERINIDWIHSNKITGFSAQLPSSSTSWIIFNLQSIGYYRVHYDQTLWNRIIAVLNNPDTFTTIDVLNRAQLLDDIFNVAKFYQTEEEDGNLYYSTAFKLAEYLKYETEYYPWYTFFTEMQYLMQIIQDEDTLTALKNKILNIISPHTLAILKDDNPSHTQILKTNLLLNWACKLGHEECIQWAKHQFQAYKDNERIDTNYRDVVLCTGLATSNDSTNDFYKIFSIFENTDKLYEQSDLIKALTCTKKENLIQQLLLKTIDYIPNQPIYSRMYNSEIISTLYTAGSEKLTSALDFVLTYNVDIKQYWQSITDPETLLIEIASKIYSQSQVNTIDAFIAKYKNEPEDRSMVAAAQKALEIAKKNIEYLDQYSAILTSVITDGLNPSASTISPEDGTTSHNNSNKIGFDILFATIFALFLKYTRQIL